MAGTEGSCPHCGENIFLPKAKKGLGWIAIIVGIAVIGCGAAIAVILRANHGHPVSNTPAHLSPFESQQEKAANGDPDAMLQLGQIYLNGNGVPTNTDEGIQWIKKAATAGNPKAMTLMGDSIFDSASRSFYASHTNDIDPATGLPLAGKPWYSLSVSNIPEECFSWYRKAAELGETNAMWQLVRNLNLGVTPPATNGTAIDPATGLPMSGAAVIDPATGLPMPMPTKETIRWLRQLVATGDTDAMIQLGSIYIHGLYIESNVDEGIKLFEKAGDLGNIGAYSTLAFMYKTGDGVTRDNFQAIKWYGKAVDKDDTAAEMDLAKLYRENEDVKDLEQSFKLYLKVAQKTAKSTNSWDNSSITDAILQVARSYDKGLGIVQDKTEAIKWYKKAADSGDTEAEWHLAVKYDLGDGVDADKHKAFQLYLKVANAPKLFGSIVQAGVAESQRNLGYLYRDGDGIGKDTQESFKWFQKSAENGDDHSQYELGKAYQTGNGVLQDKQEAFNWYLKAANQGNKSAQREMGSIYGDNLGSSQNRIEAYKWYALAAAQGDEYAIKLRDIIAPTLNASELSSALKKAKDFSVGESSTNVAPVIGQHAAASVISDKPAFEVLAVTAKPTEQNDVWWRYGYRLTVRNNFSNTDGQWFKIQFLDAQGYVIDSTTTERTVIRPGATEIITGEKLVSLPGAARVAKLKALWNP